MRIWVMAILLSTLPGTTSLLQEGVDQFDAGQFQSSAETFTYGISQHPELQQALRYNIAQAYLRLDSLSQAQTFFEQAFAAPNQPELASHASNHLGVILVRKGQYAPALEYFRRALILDANNEQARYNYELLSKRMLPPSPDEDPFDSPESDPPPEIDDETLQELIQQFNNQGRNNLSDQGIRLGDTLSLAEALRLLNKLEEQPVQFL
ncbi:MAG: tetratricopeptide repeat protein, partial [Bacteroidota bacterium]